MTRILTAEYDGLTIVIIEMTGIQCAILSTPSLLYRHPV
jgi:hypothetical protein